MAQALKAANITMLARRFHLSTREAEKKLRDAGLEPMNEVVMPSGRRFVLWDEEQGMEVLSKKIERRVPEVKAPGNPASLEEVRILLQQILEHLTKPE